MSRNNMRDNLIERMYSEQKEYRKYLISLLAEEVLSHAYEYSVREDILFAMEDVELGNDEIDALLESETPLADIYKNYAKMETDYMESIRYSIESYVHKEGKKMSQSGKGDVEVDGNPDDLTQPVKKRSGKSR